MLRAPVELSVFVWEVLVWAEGERGRVKTIRIGSGSSTSVAWSSENVFFELRSTLTAGRDPLTNRPFNREWSGLTRISRPFRDRNSVFLGCHGLFVVCEISIFYISLSAVCCWCTERAKGLDRNRDWLSGVFATETLRYVEGIKYENTVWWIKLTVPAQILPSRWCIGRNHP